MPDKLEKWQTEDLKRMNLSTYTYKAINDSRTKFTWDGLDIIIENNKYSFNKPMVVPMGDIFDFVDDWRLEQDALDSMERKKYNYEKKENKPTTVRKLIGLD